MTRSFCLFGAFFIITASLNIYAQDSRGELGEMVSGLRRRAVVVDIDARVLGEEHAVVWNETHSKTAIPGSPVGIKLVGSNVVVEAQFTPFIRRHGNVLVAHGQIWYNDPDKGMSYYTSIQTIPLEFGEPILFFPLGSSNQFGSSIEIIITVTRNTAENSAEETSSKTEHD
ncbi:MAG: hypothetical protein LBI04_05805 [Treponema sp.]|jgi:hypothetical protein|nr:hypothetical protein [Treponema sp.]